MRGEGRGQWVIQYRGQPCGGRGGAGDGPKPASRQRGDSQEVARGWEGYRLGEQAAKNSPMTKTGMKAPQGTGMVVASADIQNCR